MFSSLESRVHLTSSDLRCSFHSHLFSLTLYNRARGAERDQNSPLTTTQEEEIRQLFLSKELSKYTAVGTNIALNTYSTLAICNSRSLTVI